MKSGLMRLTVLLMFAIMIVAPFASASSASANGQREEQVFRLTILHNNDGESALVNLGSGLEDFGGAARFATLVWQEKLRSMKGNDRGTKAASVMVSSGDNFLVGPEFTASLNDGTFYDALALDLIRYDAIALGNHDFDSGPDLLADFIRGVHRSKTPFLSSNLDYSEEPELQGLVDKGRISESAIVRKRGERIGIIGATTPSLPFISSPRNVIVNDDVAGEVQAEVDRLQSKGVNKIILISHLQDVNAEIALLEQLDGVDVVVAGGGDDLLANDDDLLIPGDGPAGMPYPVIATDADGTEVPVVTTAGQYSYLGKLVIDFDDDGNLIEIHDDVSGPIRVAGGDNPDSVRPNRLVQRSVVNPVVAFVDQLASNVVATSEVDLNGVKGEVRSRETNEGNLIADAMHWQATLSASDFGVSAPDATIQNGGGIRNDSIIPAGSITELNTFEMAPFSNFVTVLEGIPRSQFKELLENAVSRVVTGDTPGGTGRFAQVSGFSMEWSKSGAAQVVNPDGAIAIAGTRIQKVTLDNGTVIVDGGVVIPGTDLTVTTNDFLARGGDQYPYRDAPFTLVGVTYQQAVAEYLRSPSGLNGTVSVADYPVGGESRIVRLP